MNIYTIETQRRPFYLVFQRAWANQLYKQVAPYIEALNSPSAINYIETLNESDAFRKEVRELWLKNWILPGREFAKSTADKYKKSTSYRIQTKDAATDFYDRYMFDYSLNEAGERITSITQTNREAILNNIRKSIVSGESEGMGADELAKFIQGNLRTDMKIISRYSAERIARTEIVGASNRGQLIGAQSLGYSMQKTWLPFIDSRTRTFNKGPFDHAITETVMLHDKFVRTGEPMDCPGDPHGSAGNLINCRCSQTFTVL